MMLVRNRNKFFLISILLLAIVGCGDRVLVDNLDDSEALEAAVALDQNGIDAEREITKSGQSPVYQIRVSNSDYSRALSILNEYAIPAHNDQVENSLAQAGSSFLPPTPEQRAWRLNYAFARELEKAIRVLPGVVRVSATVRLANITEEAATFNKDPFRNVILIVGVRAEGQKDQPTTQALQGLVTKLVPGVAPERIELKVLSISPVRDLGSSDVARLFPFKINIAKSDLKLAQTQLLLAISGALFLGFILGFFFAWLGRRRNAKHGRDIRRETTMLRSGFLEENSIRQSKAQSRDFRGQQKTR